MKPFGFKGASPLKTPTKASALHLTYFKHNFTLKYKERYSSSTFMNTLVGCQTNHIFGILEINILEF